MKKFHLFLLCMPLSLLTASAQNQDELAVANAVKNLNNAMIDANKSLLEDLTSESLSYGHSSWLIEDRQAFIAAIVEGRSRFTSIDATNQTISVSNNIAIVRHKLSGNIHNKGETPGHLNLGVLQIWQRDNGKWRLLARQATRLQ